MARQRLRIDTGGILAVAECHGGLLLYIGAMRARTKEPDMGVRATPDCVNMQTTVKDVTIKASVKHG